MMKFLRSWKRLILVMGLSTGLLASFGWPQGTQGSLTVCPQGCLFTTVQAAVDAAMPGATVEVRAGRYPENIVITKDLILRGAGVDQTFLLTAKPEQPLILIREANVRVIGFTLLALPGPPLDALARPSARGIHIIGLAQVQIESNRILGPRNGPGIEAEGPVQLRVQNNQIRDATWGIDFSGSERIAPDASDIVRGWAQAQILNNDISGHEFEGVFVGAGAQAYLRDNRIFRNTIGVYASGPTMLEKNRIFENTEAGVEVTGYARTFQNEIFANFDGILLRFKHSILIAGFDRVVDNRHWGLALHDKACGYNETLQPTDVMVRGDIRDTPLSGPGSLCPPYPGPPWPDRFVVKP